MRSHVQIPSDADIRDAIRTVLADPTWTLSMDAPTFVMNVCRQVGCPYRHGEMPNPGEPMFTRVMHLARQMPEAIIEDNDNVRDLTPDSDFATPMRCHPLIFSAQYTARPRVPA